jgi:hypothetical protein
LDKAAQEYAKLYFVKELIKILKSHKIETIRLEFKTLSWDDSGPLVFSNDEYFKKSPDNVTDWEWTYFLTEDGTFVSSSSNGFSELFNLINNLFDKSQTHYSNFSIYEIYDEMTKQAFLSDITKELSIENIETYYDNLKREHSELLNIKLAFKKLWEQCVESFYKNGDIEYEDKND